ncbi:MAG: 6-hydroxymethylpterin diphosphokinase MptE-like protein, partial [Methylococcales bacterium]
MNDFNLLSNRFQDRYLYEINRNTFNKIGSNAFFQNHFGESLVQVDSLNIIVGTDSGLLLRYLTNLDLPEGSRYLFIEPPEILELIKEFTADLDLGDQITLSSSDDWTQSLSSYNFNDYVFIERVRVIESLGATDGYLSEYRHILFNVNQKISELIWQTRASIGGRDFAEQHIDNLVEQINPAIQLKRLFTGYTAVLLAGGPSLDEAIPWVRAHQDKLLIIAVSRISRRLIETGIEPHIVVSVDPQPVSFQVSKEMLLFDPEKTVFVHANHVSFSLLAQWPGQSAYLGDTFPWKTPLNTANIGIVPPTVSNTALNLAIEMGCSRVILAGVDLCHSKEGYCHAQGSDEHSSGPQLSGVRLQVTTNGGRMAETT